MGLKELKLKKKGREAAPGALTHGSDCREPASSHSQSPHAQALSTYLLAASGLPVPAFGNVGPVVSGLESVHTKAGPSWWRVLVWGPKVGVNERASA